MPGRGEAGTLAAGFFAEAVFAGALLAGFLAAFLGDEFCERKVEQGTGGHHGTKGGNAHDAKSALSVVSTATHRRFAVELLVGLFRRGPRQEPVSHAPLLCLWESFRCDYFGCRWEGGGLSRLSVLIG